VAGGGLGGGFEAVVRGGVVGEDAVSALEVRRQLSGDMRWERASGVMGGGRRLWERVSSPDMTDSVSASRDIQNLFHAGPSESVADMELI
jgi:hypothetical protein